MYMRQNVLIVRHGPGRGRLEGYCDHVLEWIKRDRPELYARVMVHETGTTRATLEDVAGVFFWLADPLDRYPACLREAGDIEAEADERGLPILNRPSVLASYGKLYQADRFAAGGIPSPRACPVDRREDLERCARALGLPMLLRGNFSFSQHGIHLVRSRRDLASIRPEEAPGGLVATVFQDTRLRSGGRGIWSRCHHKKRVVMIGDRCVRDSLYFSRSPLVAQQTSVYQDSLRRREWLRSRGALGRRVARLTRKTPRIRQALEAERAYLEEPVSDAAVFREAGRVLGLEFLAFDYVHLPGTGPVIFEANPYPFLPAADKNLLGRARQVEPKVRRMCRAFADTMESLLPS